MALEFEFFLVRFFALLTVAVLASIGLFHGAKALSKLKGEFGMGVRWMTYGFGLMTVLQLEGSLYEPFCKKESLKDLLVKLA